MTNHTAPGLDALLADPARAAEVLIEDIPALLAQMAAEQSRLTALERVLLARLVGEAHRNGPPEDRLVTIEEAAERLATSTDWLRRHTTNLPFVVRLSDGQVRYSSKGIERFIMNRMGR